MKRLIRPVAPVCRQQRIFAELPNGCPPSRPEHLKRPCVGQYARRARGMWAGRPDHHRPDNIGNTFMEPLRARGYVLHMRCRRLPAPLNIALLRLRGYYTTFILFDMGNMYPQPKD